MTTMNMKALSERRKVSRNRHYASTLVHYLGLEEALKVCHDNMWHSVHQAIMEQFSVNERAA